MRTESYHYFRSTTSALNDGHHDDTANNDDYNCDGNDNGEDVVMTMKKTEQ